MADKGGNVNGNANAVLDKSMYRQITLDIFRDSSTHRALKFGSTSSFTLSLKNVRAE